MGLIGCALLVAVVTVILGAPFVPVAHADPDDHIPSGPNNYCPGGPSTFDSPGACTGVPYPDDTRWIEAFYRNATNPFEAPSWHRWCSFDRTDNGTSTDRVYLLNGNGCGRN